MRRYGVTLLLTLLIITAGTTATTAQQIKEQSAGECITANSSQQWESARLTGEMRLVDEGTVQITYDGHGEMSSFEVDPPRAATAINTTGFSKTKDGTYEYNGQRNTPTLTYQVRTGLSANESYASGDSWLHTPLPSYIQTRVHHTAPGGGHVGTQFAYLGNYSAVTLQDGCHQVTVIIAEESRSMVNKQQIERQLRYAMEEYDVGHRYSKTTIFVTPGTVDPTFSGRAYDGDAWASSRHGPLNTTHIVLHEYLHTRHAFGGASLGEMDWFLEGTTEYMTLRLMVNAGILSPREYNHRLKSAAGGNAVLSDRSTWSDQSVSYRRGALFNAHLDQRIREATGGERTLEDVVAAANARRGDRFLPSERKVFNIVANISNAETVAWAKGAVDSREEFGTSSIKAETTPEWKYRLSIAQENTREQPMITFIFAFILGTVVTGAVKDYASDSSDSAPEDSEAS